MSKPLATKVSTPLSENCVNILCGPVLILAGIFDLVLVIILRWKCLIVLVTF